MGLSLTLERTAGTELFRQIAHAVRTAIAAGQITPGARLPSARELSGQLCVGRGTVEAAYAMLAEEGRGQPAGRRHDRLRERWNTPGGGGGDAVHVRAGQRCSYPAADRLAATTPGAGRVPDRNLEPPGRRSGTRHILRGFGRPRS